MLNTETSHIHDSISYNQTIAKIAQNYYEQNKRMLAQKEIRGSVNTNVKANKMHHLLSISCLKVNFMFYYLK